MTRALVAKLAAGALVATTAVVVAVVLIPGSNDVAGPPGAWIDDPLNGSVAPLGTISVTAHASGAAGLAAVELAVNDAIVATQEVPGSPVFWEARFDWTATRLGSAVIRVRARGAGGEWGIPAFATIHVGERTPTPTAPGQPSTTLTPPPSSPSTTRPPTPPLGTTPPSTTPPSTPPPCLSLVAPDLATPPHQATVGTLNPTLDWRYAGPCTPGGFEVQLSSRRDFSAIDRSGITGGSTTQWSVPTGLTDCQTYYWRVRAVTGGTTGGWSSPYGFTVRVGRCP